MKILHVTAGIQETCGVSCFVMEAARTQVAMGHMVHIVSSMTCGYPVDCLSVELLDDPTKVSFMPDIVHIHCTWNMYVHKMALWCRRKKIPYIISPHGALTSWALKYKWWKKIPALLFYQYADYRNAAAFHVTVSSEECDVRRLKLTQPVIIASLGGCLYTGNKIPNGYNDILFLGRIHPVKGLDMMLRAWASLSADKRQNWRIVIAGPDDIGHQAMLKGLASELGFKVSDFSNDLQYGKKQIHGGEEVPAAVYREKLADCDSDIVFTGPVYSEAKEFLYKSAKFFILPSYSENFGVVVIEALAAGTPVITTMGTPWQELEPAGCGWWIAPETAELAKTMEKAMSLSESEYASLSDNALNFIKRHYSWQNTAEILVSAYEKYIIERVD